MNQFSKGSVKNILKKHGIRPSKGLGQNFLIDKTAVKKIIKAADISPDDVVLEIGPGSGILTRELAQRAKKVIAVEKDRRMKEILKEELRNFNNVEVIEGDILKFQIAKLKFKNYKLLGNLPFYLTAPAIRKFLESDSPPKEMILVVQKEVGQRICACQAKMSILAVSVQFYSKPEVLFYISKKSFWPSPKVDSAVIKISEINASGQSPKIDKDLFFKIVKAGFSQPRKQLANNLSKKLNLSRQKTENWLLRNKIQPSLRAETLKIEDWVNLTKDLTSWLEEVN